MFIISKCRGESNLCRHTTSKKQKPCSYGDSATSHCKTHLAAKFFGSRHPHTLTQTHTVLHTHANTSTNTQKHTHTHTNANTHKNKHTYTHTHVHTHVHTHTHTHARTHTQPGRHTNIHRHTQTHTCKHRDSPIASHIRLHSMYICSHKVKKDGMWAQIHEKRMEDFENACNTWENVTLEMSWWEEIDKKRQQESTHITRQVGTHATHKSWSLRWGWVFLERTPIFSGIQFTRYFIEIVVMETTWFVGSKVNVILNRQTCGQGSSMAARSKRQVQEFIYFIRIWMMMIVYVQKIKM